jgi:hypothetical protein
MENRKWKGGQKGMTILFDLLIWLLVLIGGGRIFWIYLKLVVIRNRFKDYLLSIGDKETIRRIGGLWFHLVIEIEDIMEERYEQTKDEEYLLYSEQYRELVAQMRKGMILLGVLIILCAIFFRKIGLYPVR